MAERFNNLRAELIALDGKLRMDVVREYERILKVAKSGQFYSEFYQDG